MKVCVKITIYWVEHFIEHCVDSLMRQTIDDVEFIFVDDATKDSSIEILQTVVKRYPHRSNQIRLIRHIRNKGLPSSRNSGLSIAEGEYIFHCDGDDFADPDMLLDLYEKAKKEDADIVWCDWFLTLDNKERYMKQPQFATAMEALKAMLCGAMKYNVWNKLVRHSLYTENHINFPDNNGMGEDMTMMMLFAVAKKVTYLNRAYYHYVKTNNNSFCQTYSDKHLVELYHNVMRIENYINTHFSCSLDRELHFFKLEAKFPFLISDGSRGQYQLWKEWFSESNSYIMQNTWISTRSRILQWCASKNLFGLVWLYYQVVMRFIYNVLY